MYFGNTLLFILCLAMNLIQAQCSEYGGSVECIEGPNNTYNGTRNMTASGRTCQRWDVDRPHKPVYTPDDDARHNYCRNPDDDVRGPWCYTTDAAKRWEYCDIPKCPNAETRVATVAQTTPSMQSSEGIVKSAPAATTSFTKNEMKGTEECIDETNVGYNGTRNTTTSGRTCQRWDVVRPHNPIYKPPDINHNYCRNPDDDVRGPWCYTTDATTRWEYCNIPKCPTTEATVPNVPPTTQATETSNGIVESTSAPSTTTTTNARNEIEDAEDCIRGSGVRYNGTRSTTVSGRNCQRWDVFTPHRPTFTPHDRNHNYCRNPDVDVKGPWCYTVDATKRWEYCNIPNCTAAETTAATVAQTTLSIQISEGIVKSTPAPTTSFTKNEMKGTEECIDETSVGYNGTRNATASGRTCQRWDVVRPHMPIYKPPDINHNYCRNPDDDVRGPWCYTTDATKRWEYCNIPKCPTTEVIVPNVPQTTQATQTFNGIVKSTSAPSTTTISTSTTNRNEIEEAEDCIEGSGVRYNGTRSTTVSGRTCQRWDVSTPHEPTITPHDRNHNYCRNPANDVKRPWCYTVDATKRWEYCNIPKCNLCVPELGLVHVH